MFRLLNERSDARTVARVLAGDREEFGQLIDRHGGPAFAVARTLVLSPADAEDVVQDAFINAFQKLDTLQQPHRFGAWLLTIVRNTALRLRERRLREQPLTEAHEKVEKPDPHQREIEEIIQSGMSRLEGEQREVLALYYFSGKSVKECAALLDISKDAAAKRLQRARSALGEELITRLGPEAREAFALDARKKKAILGTVLAAGASWKAAAGTGAAVGVAGLGIKTALAGATILALGAASIFVVPDLVQTSISDATEQTADTSAVATNGSNDEDTSANANAAAQEISTESSGEEATEGPGRIEVTMKDLDGNIVPGANCVLEKISWGPREMPPAETIKWTAKADDNGTVVFENLPLGTVALTAVATQLAGLMDYELTAKYPTREGRVLELLPYRRDLHGEVVGEDDSPIADAIVYPIEHELYEGQIVDHAQTAPVRARSDSDGAFTVPFIWPGKMRYYVYAEGYAPFISDWASHQDTIRFVLDKGRDLAGVLIHEATEEPIAGVPITFDLAKRFEHETVTDAEGRFSIPGAAAGKYRVALDDPALVLSDGRELVVTAEMETLEVKARTGGVVMGSVTNAETGEGIPGVEVRAYAGGSSGETISGPGGEFIVMGLGEGNGQVSIRDTPGFTDWGGERARSRKYRDIILSAGQVIEDVNFSLIPAVGTSGIVVDRDNKPVPDAEVLVKVDAGSRYAYQNHHDTDTDEAGRFTVDSIPKNTILRLQARTDDWSSETLYLEDENALAQEVRLVLDQPLSASIRGRVVGPGGGTLPEATVRFEDEHWFYWPADMAPDNSFELSGLPAGTYKVNIYYESTQGHGIGCPEIPPLTLVAGQVLENQTYQCGSGGDLSITGTVYRPDGRTKAGAQVSLLHTPVTALTDVRGQFELKGLENKSYRIVATARGFASNEMDTVQADTHGLELYLREMMTLSGTITDASTGAPLRARVYTFVNDNYVDTAVDENGAFEFKRLEGTPGMVIAEHPGYAPARVDVHFDPGATETTLDIAMEAAAKIAGTVVDPEGSPLGNVGIRIGSDFQINNFTDSLGRFSIDGKAAGSEIILTFEHESYGATLVKVVCGTAASENLLVTLQQGPELELRMTVNGEPLTEFNYTLNRVSKLGSVMSSHGTVSPVDGVYIVGDAPPGEYNVNVNAMMDIGNGESRRASYDELVQLVAGQRTVLENDFRIGTGRIHGLIMDDQGEAVANAHVYLSTGTASRHNLSDQAESGAYELTGIAAGEYILKAQADLGNNTWRMKEVPVSLADGEIKALNITISGSNTILIAAEPGALIQIFSGDADRSHIENPQVGTHGWVTPPLAAGATDLDGSAEFTRMPDGTYWVAWYDFVAPAEFNARAIQSVTVSGGEQVEVQL